MDRSLLSGFDGWNWVNVPTSEDELYVDLALPVPETHVECQYSVVVLYIPQTLVDQTLKSPGSYDWLTLLRAMVFGYAPRKRHALATKKEDASQLTDPTSQLTDARPWPRASAVLLATKH